MSSDASGLARDVGAAPRVSVIVIVRDGARFIEEALASIAAQTMPSHETIVVDDGSRDRTVEIVGRCVARDPARMRLVRHEHGSNRGMSASRNLGIRHARGGYITFLDHDDAMLPEKLARHMALLDAHPEASAVVGPNIRWRSWCVGAGSHGARSSGVGHDDDAPRHEDDAPRNEDDAPGHEDDVQRLGVNGQAILAPPGLLPFFLRRTASTPQAPMVLRAAIDAIGGFEDTFTDMYEDQVFLSKLFLHGSVFVDTQPLHRYRQHDDSCVSRSHREGRQRAARRRFLRWLQGRLAQVDGPVAAELRPIVAAELRASWLASLRAIPSRVRALLGLRR